MTATYNFERISLLIADPSRYMRSLFLGLARSYGFRSILEAADGAVALDRLREHHVDIVLVDGSMTPMDGFEFTKTVRTSPEIPNPFVPVIMVSAHTELGQVRRARDSGVTEFLAKPISAKTLLVRLCSVIDNQRAFVRAAKFIGPDRRRHTDQAFQGQERRGVPRPAKPVVAEVPPHPEGLPSGGALDRKDIKALLEDDDGKNAV
ncbi:MAG: response regulator [Alphaproteobacteria bacterium]|nr:response regulator [Alphaproteobacteria bacterium]